MIAASQLFCAPGQALACRAANGAGLAGQYDACLHAGARAAAA